VIGMSEDNDGRFPDESEVLVRYPIGPDPERQPGTSDDEHLAVLRADREGWPWLLGIIEHQCGPDEWKVTVEDRRLAELEDGSPAPEGTADEDLWFPQCFRDSSEIRRTASLADSPAFNQLIARQLGDVTGPEAGQ
jgi:hypothetical protein